MTLNMWSLTLLNVGGTWHTVVVAAPGICITHTVVLCRILHFDSMYLYVA